MTILLIIVGGLVSTGMLWIASARLETSTHRLSERYGIPDAVRGSLFMAVASSMPELATGVLALGVHEDFELGMSAIVGSAIYNILVIPACSVFARGRSLRSNRELVFREAQFYLVSVAALLLASLGIYGIISYSVSQRTTEMGLRKALGAADSDIVHLVVRNSMKFVAIGMVLGLAGGGSEPAGARPRH